MRLHIIIDIKILKNRRFTQWILLKILNFLVKKKWFQKQVNYKRMVNPN